MLCLSFLAFMEATIRYNIRQSNKLHQLKWTPPNAINHYKTNKQIFTTLGLEERVILEDGPRGLIKSDLTHQFLSNSPPQKVYCHTWPRGKRHPRGCSEWAYQI